MPRAAASLRHAPEELALVADIGGTNARFALASLDDPGHAIHEARWPVEDFDSLAEAADAYLKEKAPGGGIRFGMVAVASPANEDVIKVTNSAWHFSLEETRRALGFDALYAINDFAANSWAIAELGDRQFTALGGPAKRPEGQGTFAVVGPGTGLGVGAILRGGGGTAVISSEGGHVDFAPVSDEEIQILAWLRERYHRVSYERLLCGPGLLNIYHAIGGSEAVTTPEQVTGAGGDELAARAIRIFCEVLGSFAGNAALTFGAWGGVYVAGNLLQAMRDELVQGGFRTRFDDKGRFGKELAKVPTLLVDEPALGLIGAAAALRHRVGG
ncbi:MAG: glucokinase [Sphingomonadaceae bacterium]|nr:glucokinase [Sphingomonadaceae bacterium]